MIRSVFILIFLICLGFPALAQNKQDKGTDPANKMILRANTRDQVIISRGSMHQMMIRQRKHDAMKKNQMQMHRRMQMQQHRRVMRHQHVRRRNAQRQAIQRKRYAGGR